MKKQFQSKSVPRGTRTIWRYLSALFLLFTFGIGQMWGADEVKLVSEGTTAISKIAGTGVAPTYLGTVASPAVYKSSDKSYSVSISTTFSVNEGSEYKPDGSTKYKDYYYNANGGCDMNADPTNYIKVAATGCKISKIVLRAERFNSTSACFPAVGFISGLPETSTIGKKTGRIVDVRITDQVGTYNSIKSFEKASTLTYTFSTNVSEVYLSKQIKSIATSEETAFASYPSSSQSYGVFGIDVYVVPNPPTTYTVTLNPNGGATNDENWTLNEGNYTKSNIAKDASVALPEMTRTGYTFAVWKNANNETVNSPITVTENVTLNATWNIKSYSLTWNIPGDATITNPETYTHGTVAYGTTIVPPTLTREGFDFLGWNTAVAETMPDDNLTYTAQWQIAAAKHDISYTNLKEQSVDGYPTQYTEGIGIASFDALSDVAGFHFTGWSPDAIPADATDDPFVVTAQWVPTYSVTYNLTGAASGTLPTEAAKYEGQEFALAAQGDIVAPANKQFLGWKDQDGNKYDAEANFTMPGKAVTLTVHWATKVENVIYSWESPEGTPVEVGGTAKFYTGDTDNSSATTDNRVNYANKPINGDNATQYYTLRLDKAVDYSAEHVRIALNSALKEGDKIAITAYYTKDQTKTVAPKIANGSNAVICSTDNLPNLYGGGTPTTQTKTLNANAEGATTLKLTRTTTSTTAWITKLRIYRESYIDDDDMLTVTFNSNGGSTVNSVQVVSGQTIAKPADPTKAHNRFNEWQLSGSAYNFATPVTANITLDADWTPLYTVTYDANGGSGTMTDAKEYAAGEEVTLKANEFTYSGMQFVSWAVTETVNGNAVTVTNNKFTMPGAAVTVKATWEVYVPGNYVVYNGSGNDGGSVPVDADKYLADANVTVLGKGDMTKTIGGESAAFHGWNTNSDMVSGTHYDAGAEFTMPDAEVNLYAVWGFAINYNLDGGTINDATYATWYVSTGTTTSISTPLPSNVTREGYTFDGWYTQNGAGNKVASINAEYTGDFAGDWALKAKWILTAPIGKAQSIDMEGLVESDGTSAEWQNYLYSHGYSFSTENVSLDEKKDPSENKAYDNWPYQGLKMKKSGAYVQGTVEADKLVIIKLGHMAADATVTIGGVAQEDATGLDAAEPAGQPNYYYVENESVLRYETTNDGACVLKAITITDPYTVSFAAHGDADPAALVGHPAVTLPTPTNGTASFLGWFTAETGGTRIGDAGESYTPSADITLHAQWEAISTDARLSAIEITPNTGVLSPAFNMEWTEYTYTMPYGSALPTVIGATANHEGATWYIESAATAWGETTIVRGKALSNDTKAYNITMLQGPKDGVSIIKATINSTTKNTIGEVTGIYKKDASTSGLSSYKFNGKGAYIGLELMAGQTFQAGDIINIHTTQASSQGSIALYNDHGNTVTPFYDYEIKGGQGDNKLVLPAAADGKSIIYVCRTEANTWNGYVDFIDVTRAMMPELTAITIDERAGEIDPLDDKHFNVLIPYEADLAALNVEPTIVWNGAHATTPTTVISHEGAWVLAADGDNTYRIMDKDGDYTDYTITLTRDVKKYTVSFNAQGGSTVQSELVVAGEKLAAAPADPTREDYQFLGWAEAAEGEVVDVTDFVINADKEFYAQWKYENPIVILDESGDIDHDNFFTGMGKGTVNFGGADHNCISFGSTASTIVGATGSNKFIVYNAKTNQTRIKFVLYNTQNSEQKIVLQRLAEGATAIAEEDNIEIAVPSKERYETEYYAYNSDVNRTMYVFTKNTGIKVLQVKVIESGTPIHQAGQAGYVLNLNKGRVFAPSNEDVEFEGLSMKVSSNYKVLNSEVLQTQNNLSFKVDELVTMTLVSTGAKYQVSKDPAGSGTEYEQGTNKHTLTPGTWYIVSSTGSNMKFTNISFSEPVADYTRPVNPSFLGTLCWTNDAILGGGTLYEFAGKDEHNYLAFDEVEENRLEAGKPYIFMPENGNTEIKVYNIDDAAALTEDQAPVNHMYGTIQGKTLTQADNADMYYFSSNHIWRVGDFNVNIEVPAYYCYVDYKAVLNDNPAPVPAPGRRRVTMGVNGQNTTTGIGEIEASETPMKVMINGQIFIIRGEKMYDVTGKLVK